MVMTDSPETTSRIAAASKRLEKFYRDMTPEERAEYDQKGTEQEQSVNDSVNKGRRGYKA